MYGNSNMKFNFSSGWLECFKARHGIKFYLMFDESGLIAMENTKPALPSVKAKLDQFQWKDIYNMDEMMSLFYRLEANHSLAIKQLEGQKKDNKRITISVGCNGDSFDKVTLWVIGKYVITRCFKNVNIINLNCHY